MPLTSQLSPAAIARHREGIKVGQIIDRLEKHTFGTLTNAKGEPIEMSKTQIAAAKILLGKVLPDLRAMELSAAPGTAGGFVLFGQREAETTADWVAEHGKGDGG